MVQCRPAPLSPPMVMGGQPCFSWFPPPLWPVVVLGVGDIGDGWPV